MFRYHFSVMAYARNRSPRYAKEKIMYGIGKSRHVAQKNVVRDVQDAGFCVRDIKLLSAEEIGGAK